MAATGERPATDAAREAWGLLWEVLMRDRRRRWEILSELGISPQQSLAIVSLSADEPLPMSALAEALHCDNSNITGIVDRLEAAGLARRQADARDRRVKAVVLTPEGERLQVEIQRRVGEPPPTMASLSSEDAVALRDILARALGSE